MPSTTPTQPTPSIPTNESWYNTKLDAPELAVYGNSGVSPDVFLHNVDTNKRWSMSILRNLMNDNPTEWTEKFIVPRIMSYVESIATFDWAFHLKHGTMEPGCLILSNGSRIRRYVPWLDLPTFIHSKLSANLCNIMSILDILSIYVATCILCEITIQSKLTLFPQQPAIVPIVGLNGVDVEGPWGRSAIKRFLCICNQCKISCVDCHSYAFEGSVITVGSINSMLKSNLCINCSKSLLSEYKPPRIQHSRLRGLLWRLEKL